MEQLAVQLGAFGALVVVLVGLVVALRNGTLVTGRQLEREQAVHDAAIAYERAQTQQWRDAHTAAAESLRVALDANELLAQQADRLVSGTELTQRLIEAMRVKVDHDRSA